jgi:uncharacterized protein YjbI with pentapeptide repeats
VAAGGIVLVGIVVAVLFRPSWRDSMSVSIVGWLLVAAVVGVVTGGLLLWLLGWPSLPRSSSYTTAETLDLLKIALAVIGGFGGVVILSVNHRKQRFTEKAHTLAEEQDRRERAKLQNERFAAAAEQLAHERPQVRLAGVYALAGLADDWDEGRQKCVEVLISYLRLAQSDDRAPGAGEDEVVATILRTFRERLARAAGSPWQDMDFDFTGMAFDDADFGGLRFAGTVTFDGAVFTGDNTSFAETWFEGMLSCHGATFGAQETNFRRAWFDGAAEFVGARFAADLDLRDVWIDKGNVDFYQCGFDGPVQGAALDVDPGTLRFDRCMFTGRSVDFTWATIGPSIARPPLGDLLRGRGTRTRIPLLAFMNCELAGCRMTMDDAAMANGKVVITDLTVRRGELRIRPAEIRHPSLLVRRIDAHPSTIDIPVPERIWQAGVPPAPAALPSDQ